MSPFAGLKACRRDLIGAWLDVPTEACPPAVLPFVVRPKGGPAMIVVGIDPHKRSHTAAAVEGSTAATRGEITVPARPAGHERLLGWARRLDNERVFAMEDCRHVSTSLERFLIVSGERVVRVPPKLMAGVRRSARSRGKSDPIDAKAVALAAVREPSLPQAHLAGVERDLKLLVDHREALVNERTRVQSRLRWHLHTIDSDMQIPAGALDRMVWIERAAQRLAEHGGTIEVRLARRLVARCGELTVEVNELEREIRRMVRTQCPELLRVPGCAELTAAKLVGEVAGVTRFATEAKLALYGGVAPLEVSSGEHRRHRLNRSGNRQLNAALHRIAVTQKRMHPPAQAFLERNEREGKNSREALRCLKRHLVRTVFHLLKEAEGRASSELLVPSRTRLVNHLSPVA